MMCNSNNVTAQGTEILMMSVNAPLPIPHTNASSASSLRPESERGDELTSSWMLRQALSQSVCAPPAQSSSTLNALPSLTWQPVPSKSEPLSIVKTLLRRCNISSCFQPDWRRGKQRLFTYSANEISHLCGSKIKRYSTRTSASRPRSDWVGFKQIYGLRWGNRGIWGPELNHDYEELIRSSKGTVWFSNRSTTEHCATCKLPLFLPYMVAV